MIAASEPLEFVPHGRYELINHPGNVREPKNVCSLNKSLLYKLTKCAIKDDTMLDGKEGKEKEYWSVRLVYENATDEENIIEDDKESTSTVKEETLQEKVRRKSDFNFSYKSERALHTLKRIGSEGNLGHLATTTSSTASNLSKRFIPPDKVKTKTAESFNPKVDCCYEEELYVKGKTAVWSKGLISTPGTRMTEPQHRELIRCYTLESPIKHALFCNFEVTINNTMLIDSLEPNLGEFKDLKQTDDKTKFTPTSLPSICLIDEDSIRVFTKNGNDFISSLPFQVKKVWPMKYGILLEKDATKIVHNRYFPPSFIRNESLVGSATKNKYSSAKSRSFSFLTNDQDFQLPTCFSLCHPLDEMSPVLMKSATHAIQYYNESDLTITFTSCNPSLVLLYDWKLHNHSLWKLRKASREECISSCNLNGTSTEMSQSENLGSFSASKSYSRQTSQRATGSSWMTGLGSLQNTRTRNVTPIQSRSRSKLASPIVNALQHELSPHSTLCHPSFMSASGNTMRPPPPSLPIYPEICLEHLWTEGQQPMKQWSSSPKAFLHTDQIGQDFLCYLVHYVEESKLHLLRLRKSRGNGDVIVGTSSFIAARDAVSLEHLKMIAIIDDTGNIIMYTGNVVIGKVHVGGVLARLITSPYNKRTTLNSPFPRRSSLLPSRSNDVSVFDDSVLHLLSPVPHLITSSEKTESNMGLLGLRDPIGNRLTLEFDKETYYRISLPELTSCFLVKRCIDGLQSILQKDVCIQIIGKWYGVRNAPGTQDLTIEQEWNMFVSTIFSMLGYELPKYDHSDNSDIVTKRQKTVRQGKLEDWEYLLKSDYNKSNSDHLKELLRLQKDWKAPVVLNRKESKSDTQQFNANAILFPYTSQVFFCLHLIYEESKLNTLYDGDLKPLAKMLHQISKDLRLNEYTLHYWKDFPDDLSMSAERDEQLIPEMNLKHLIQPAYLSSDPPNIFKYLNDILKCNDVLEAYPYLNDVNIISKNIIEIVSYLATGVMAIVNNISVVKSDFINASSTPRMRESLLCGIDDQKLASNAVIMMVERDITYSSIENYPPAISLILLTAIDQCKESPPLDWPLEAFNLLNREDLALHMKVKEKDKDNLNYAEATLDPSCDKENAFTLCESQLSDSSNNQTSDEEMKTGLEQMETKLIRLLYPKDHRVREVCSMLQSSIPVTINLPQRHEVSDHDFIEEQEKQLQAINVRTTALPIARGAMSLRTSAWSKLSNARVARVCASARGSRGERIEGPSGIAWPNFHAGVAAGLSLAAAPLPAQWVLYNKKGTPEMSSEHAGFLLGLGLNGHLKDMTSPNIYDYLVKCQEMVSVGFLLGLAATYRGTMDVQATKMMSIHLESLLPPTSIELDIHHNMLVAALMGLGLLYEGSLHLHLCQKLLNEIGKPPGPEMENSSEREGHALAAGLALGHVICGKYKEAPQSIARALRLHITAGTPRPNIGNLKEKYKQPSFQIREGNTLNVDVTAPGSTLALGLLYFRSNDATVAEWLAPPTSQFLLDSVRPDLLMLRIIARSLIFWDSIEPSEQWVEAQIPEIIRPYIFVKPTESHIDYEAMNQAYCNIVAGACFGMGLRFAGSNDSDARDCLLEYVNMFVTLAGKTIGELAGKSMIESCFVVMLLAASLVTAGHGDVHVIRAARRLWLRAGRTRGALSHGGHVAVSMAMGLQFLGGARCTIRADKTTLPALIDAFFPKFPTHTEDTRYHLQAFRHLYVLAVEPRLIIPRDVTTGKLCYANLQAVTLDKGEIIEMRAPCILPDLETLKEIRINDSRYWPIIFKRDHNWEQLKKYLNQSWCIDLKKHAGCLSHLDDPQGFLTLLAQNLTLDQMNVWSAKPDNILTFTGDENVRTLTRVYLDPSGSVQEEEQFIRELCIALYECVLKDMLCALPVWTSFLKVVQAVKTSPTSVQIWQIKLLESHLESQNRKQANNVKLKPLIGKEFCQAIKQKCFNILDAYQYKLRESLKSYLGIQSSRIEQGCERFLSAFVTYYDVPRNVSNNFVDYKILQLFSELNVDV